MGDGLGFEAQFDDLYRVAYRVSFRLLGDRAEAEDVTQESLTRAYRRWLRIAGYETAWVSRVAANLSIDHLRRNRRAVHQPANDSVAARSPSDLRVDLQRALLALSRRQREVVVLRYVADLSERDVAQALGCSHGTIKTHASRGLDALRTRLGADYEIAISTG